VAVIAAAPPVVNFGQPAQRVEAHPAGRDAHPRAERLLELLERARLEPAHGMRTEPVSLLLRQPA